MQAIHIFALFKIHSVFSRCLFHSSGRNNTEQSDMEKEGPGNAPPPAIFFSSHQETSCPESRERDGRSEVVYHLTGKLEHDAKQCSPSFIFQTLVPTHHRSVNRGCLVRVHLTKLASNTGVRFQLCQMQNALPQGKHFFSGLKSSV